VQRFIVARAIEDRAQLERSRDVIPRGKYSRLPSYCRCRSDEAARKNPRIRSVAGGIRCSGCETESDS
jgi:hypothetical protein